MPGLPAHGNLDWSNHDKTDLGTGEDATFGRDQAVRLLSQCVAEYRYHTCTGNTKPLSQAESLPASYRMDVLYTRVAWYVAFLHGDLGAVSIPVRSAILSGSCDR